MRCGYGACCLATPYTHVFFIAEVCSQTVGRRLRWEQIWMFLLIVETLFVKDLGGCTGRKTITSLPLAARPRQLQCYRSVQCTLLQCAMLRRALTA